MRIIATSPPSERANRLCSTHFLEVAVAWTVERLMSWRGYELTICGDLMLFSQLFISTAPKAVRTVNLGLDATNCLLRKQEGISL